MEDLINYWKQLDLSVKPYVHCADILLKSEYCLSHNDYEEYVSNKDFWINKGLFHTNLIPIPFIGNLKSAKIFILLLNPGLNLADYYAEQTAPNYVDELKRNLRQENLNSEYPFIFLNPKFLWHPGGQYWLNKLKDYILDISKN